MFDDDDSDSEALEPTDLENRDPLEIAAHSHGYAHVSPRDSAAILELQFGQLTPAQHMAVVEAYETGRRERREHERARTAPVPANAQIPF